MDDCMEIAGLLVRQTDGLIELPSYLTEWLNTKPCLWKNWLDRNGKVSGGEAGSCKRLTSTEARRSLR
jgi:hypothetical protein